MTASMMSEFLASYTAWRWLELITRREKVHDFLCSGSSALLRLLETHKASLATIAPRLRAFQSPNTL
jgi:hypothetical protein